MDEKVKRALERDQTIDITTTGRKTGLPGRRDWYANLQANPDFIFHLKESVQVDLPARAKPIAAEAERRAVLARILQNLGSQRDLEEWVARSPLVEVELNVE
jgi:hypothetical protein